MDRSGKNQRARRSYRLSGGLDVRLGFFRPFAAGVLLEGGRNSLGRLWADCASCTSYIDEHLSMLYVYINPGTGRSPPDPVASVKTPSLNQLLGIPPVPCSAHGFALPGASLQAA